MGLVKEEAFSKISNKEDRGRRPAPVNILKMTKEIDEQMIYFDRIFTIFYKLDLYVGDNRPKYIAIIALSSLQYMFILLVDTILQTLHFNLIFGFKNVSDSAIVTLIFIGLFIINLARYKQARINLILSSYDQLSEGEKKLWLLITIISFLIPVAITFHFSPAPIR